MFPRFQRNLLLALLLTGVVLQAFAVYVVLHVLREGYVQAAGRETAGLAAIAARAIGEGLLDGAGKVERFDPASLRPSFDSAALSLIRPLVARDPAAERRYLVDREGQRVLATDGAPLSATALERAVALSRTAAVAVLPSAGDRAILFARALSVADDSPAGYLIVAVAPEEALAPALSLFGPGSTTRLLLADATGQLIAGSVEEEPLIDLYGRPYATLQRAGKGQLSAAARLAKPLQADGIFVVVARDLGELLTPYGTAIASVLGLEILLLGLVFAASFKIAQHFNQPAEVLRHGLELMVGANPAHRISLAQAGELADLARFVNRLADISGATRLELEREVANATRMIAFEREKLASILFSLADGVIVCDYELRVILVNKAARDILATTWKPARRGRGIYAYLDAARLKPLVDAMADKPRATKRGTFTLANGTIIHATAVAVGEGEERSYIFLLRDITPLVALDRQRHRAVDETLQSLRGPLASLISFTDILMEYRWLDDARRTHFLSVMREEAEKLIETLDAVQAQAEATSSPIEWAMEAADIGAFAREEAEQLRPVAEQRMLQLAAVGEEAVVTGDVLSLRQLVRRLFEFGVGFAAEGSRVEARWAEKPDGWVEFQVAYVGRPLDPEEMEGIFENPLYIGGGDEPPTSRQVATIREIVKQHGGEVWAKNADGGASLSFILPAKAPPPAERIEEASDTVGKQITALLGDGSFYDFRVARELPAEVLASTPLDQLSFVVLDLETTGLHPRLGDEIVAIAGIRVERGEIIKEDCFYTLVNPRRPIPAASTRVHGITDHMVAGQPFIEDVLPKFLDFKGDSLLGGHFISFDLSFLKPKLVELGLSAKTEPTLDTLLLSYGLFKDWEDYNLEDIANNLGVKVVARHTALGDAYVTAQLFLQLFKLMEGRGMGTLGDALRLQNRDVLARFIGVAAGAGEGA